MRRPIHSPAGSVTLVALCFLAVLSIALASYLAVSKQAMTLSNRSSMGGVSGQLAEIGLERALWSFNRNDWSSWTITGNTATRTVTFPNTKYGKIGVTGTVNLRVDNYNAFNLSSVWDGGTTYGIHDLVGRNGIWYRSLQNPNFNHAPPNIAYWAEDPIPWKWNSGAYHVGDLVNQGGAWYRCNTDHTAPHRPPNVSYWTPVPILSQPWSSGVMYLSTDDIMYWNGTWWSPTGLGAGLLNALLHIPPLLGLNFSQADISWNWSIVKAYDFNDVVFYQDVWYRCIQAHTGQMPPNSTYWVNSLSLWPWSSTANYNLNDVVYYSGSFYRCVLAHTAQSPPNATYWSNAPLASNTWDPEKTYDVDDVVVYAGAWYRCSASSNLNHAPPNAAYWISASTAAAYKWNPATPYGSGTYASYGGVWYKCIAATTNQSPNDLNYWSAISAPVVYAEGVATLPDATAQTVKIQLRGTVASAPLFPNAVAATSTLNFSSGSTSGLIDSYNSAQGTYNSIAAPFSAGSPNNSYSAVLAAGATTGTALTLTGGNVQGYVAAPSAATSPYAPLFSFGAGVNLKGTSAGTGVDLTRVSRSPYIPQFDILPVAQRTELVIPSPWPVGGISIGTPGATTPTVYYITSGLDLNGMNNNISILGPVVLDIQGRLEVRANGKITIATTGSAEIHFNDRLRMDQTPGSGIDNLTLDPKKLILIGSVTGNNSYIRSPIPFYGVIYLPNGQLPVDDVGTNVEIYGAISAGTVTYPSIPKLHYDTSLRAATFGGTDAPYAITEWRELTTPSEKVTF